MHVFILIACISCFSTPGKEKTLQTAIHSSPFVAHNRSIVVQEADDAKTKVFLHLHFISSISTPLSNFLEHITLSWQDFINLVVLIILDISPYHSNVLAFLFVSNVSHNSAPRTTE